MSFHVYLYWESVYSNSLPLFKLHNSYFYYWIVNVLYISWTQVLIRYTICEYISPSVSWFFTFLLCPMNHKVFILMKYNLSVMFFATCTFEVVSKKLVPNLNLWRFTPMLSMGFTLGLLSILSSFLCIVWREIHLNSFIWVFSCPSTICWKTQPLLMSPPD